MDMTNTQQARKSDSHAQELRKVADSLLTGNNNHWQHLKAVKADQRYWQYVHGYGCGCWDCKGN
jgi:hypothetical protein